MQKNAIPIMPHININNSINVVISISSCLSLLIKSISLYHNKNFYFFHLSFVSMIYGTKKQPIALTDCLFCYIKFLFHVTHKREVVNFFII